MRNNCILYACLDKNSNQIFRVEKLPEGKPASFDMFCSIMLPTFNEQGEERTVDQELMEAFKAFDKDGNGYISATELKSMMRSLGDRVSDEDVQKIIAEVDVNGDGMVSYEEYLTMMRPNNKNRSNDIKRKKERNRKSLLNVKGWFHKSKREK
jgi:Ca2+-binding EF-hand superfamily protein